MRTMRLDRRLLSLALGLALLALPAVAGELEYPTTAKGDVVDDYHGTQVADPFRWLEDELDRARKALLALLENACCGEQHCCVRIVAAGVHFPLSLRAKRSANLLQNGECIHVST